MVLRPTEVTVKIDDVTFVIEEAVVTPCPLVSCLTVGDLLDDLARTA